MTAALAQAPAQMQSLSAKHFEGATVHFEGATINISNDAEAERMTPPTKDMGWNQYLWTLQPWVLLTLCLNITPVTMGCSSATSTQVKRKMNEYQSHPPLPNRRILLATLTSPE